MATERTYWRSYDLGIANEPLLASLIKYRQRRNRYRVLRVEDANLVSSRTTDGRQMPIIDLDFDFEIRESSTPGHYHLLLNKPISNVKFVVLMLVLWWTGSVEMGYAVWSIRRMGNFARVPGVAKKPGAETNKPQYGWLFRLKEKK